MNVKEFENEILKMYVEFIQDVESRGIVFGMDKLRSLQKTFFSLSVNLGSFIEYSEGLNHAIVKVSENVNVVANEGDKESGYIYIVSYDDMTKIGISIDPKSRINSLQTSNPKSFENFFVSERTEDYKSIEKQLHDFFNDHRLKGEWFDITFERAVSALRKFI